MKIVYQILPWIWKALTFFLTQERKRRLKNIRLYKTVVLKMKKMGFLPIHEGDLDWGKIKQHINVLFIDDDEFLQTHRILQKAGWNNCDVILGDDAKDFNINKQTTRNKINKALIVFCDINGVGMQTGEVQGLNVLDSLLNDFGSQKGWCAITVALGSLSIQQAHPIMQKLDKILDKADKAAAYDETIREIFMTRVKDGIPNFRDIALKCLNRPPQKKRHRKQKH